MFADPTLADFAAQIDHCIERAIYDATMAVHHVRQEAIMHGASGGSRSILRECEVLKDHFDVGVSEVLSLTQKAIKQLKLDPSEIREVAHQKLRNYLNQIKKISAPNIATNAFGDMRGSITAKAFPKLDAALEYQLRQFDIGAWGAEEANVKNFVIVHGDGNNIIAGDQNTAQQAARASQIIVHAGDIKEKLGLIERELANVNLRDAELLEMRGSLETIKAQLFRPTPSTSSVKEAVLSIQRVVENAAGNLLASPLGQAVVALATLVGLN
jgi:hypothetical protein